MSIAENRNRKAWAEAKQTVFELWQQILPVLANYPYNQSY
jgi:hypothetical protein